jgi:high-affinity Fe2+/Pb2+ permease
MVDFFLHIIIINFFSRIRLLFKAVLLLAVIAGRTQNMKTLIIITQCTYIIEIYRLMYRSRFSENRERADVRFG